MDRLSLCQGIFGKKVQDASCCSNVRLAVLWGPDDNIHTLNATKVVFHKAEGFEGTDRFLRPVPSPNKVLNENYRIPFKRSVHDPDNFWNGLHRIRFESPITCRYNSGCYPRINGQNRCHVYQSVSLSAMLSDGLKILLMRLRSGYTVPSRPVDGGSTVTSSTTSAPITVSRMSSR